MSLIGHSDAARRKSWRRTGFVMLILAGGTVAVGLGARAPGVWIGGFGVFSMPALFGMVNGIYGRVLLTETGMQWLQPSMSSARRSRRRPH